MPTALHARLKSKGFINRQNPELLRLADKTGLSVEWIFKVALGRPASRAAAIAISKACRDKSITVDDLMADQ